MAKEALKTAQVAETGLKAQVTNAAAQLDQAKTTKNYSSIIAPMDGQLGEVNPRVGQYVAAGTQLLYLIPQQTWVTANFKETQIANMKIGQKAWFTVDALNHQKFTGHVEQISQRRVQSSVYLKLIMRQVTLPKWYNALRYGLQLIRIKQALKTYVQACP